MMTLENATSPLFQKLVMDSGIIPEKGLYVYWLDHMPPSRMRLSTMTSRHLLRGVYVELEVIPETGQVVRYQHYVLPKEN